MEEKKIKKKKLTLSISGKKHQSVPHYPQGRGKTSVVIEKKPSRRWGEKKFRSQESSYNRPKQTGDFVQKKTALNRNVDIRKIAEEKATKRFKNLKEDNLQVKKNS